MEQLLESNRILAINGTRIPHKNLIEAIIIRRAENKLLELYRDGLIDGTVHTCIGQELNSVAVSQHLAKADYVFSNHRGHGHYLARTRDYYGLFAELMGKSTGCSGGYGGSQHLMHERYFSNGVQGGMVPIAVGAAFGLSYRQEEAVSVVYIGDGTFGEGLIYESFNISALWGLPLVVVVEDNQIAQSTSKRQNMAGTIRDRAIAFGLVHRKCETNCFEILRKTCEESISEARLKKVPQLIEISSQRLMSHSKGDDNRCPDAISKLWQQDLLEMYRLIEPEAYRYDNEEASKYIDQIVGKVQSDGVLRIKGSSQAIDSHVRWSDSVDKRSDDAGNVEIYKGIQRLLEHDKNVVLVGEDIEDDNSFHPGRYGGAFKVTQDLSKKYQGRVLNTPISEAAITGIATGMSLTGLRPIVEIMFGDFLTLTLDQLLQHASKITLMYGRKIAVPIIVRTPMGGGRGYGPTHSQCIEKHFLGIPGLDVIALNHRISAELMYGLRLAQHTRPTLVIENKRCYSKKVNRFDLANYKINQTDECFPSIFISPISDRKKSSISIICYGGILIDMEEALDELFYDHEILCDVICPTLISESVVAVCVAESVRNTGRLLVVEEGATFAAWGSAMIARVVELSQNCFKLKQLGNNSVIPAARKAESDVLISKGGIVEAVIDLVNEN